MNNIYDIMLERGLIEQCTHEDELRETFDKERVVFYIGFDPTAESLHIGHFIQIKMMMHLQKQGHIPIVVIGNGTAMIGDPSGKTELRAIETVQTLDERVKRIRKQIEKFLVLDGKKGHFVKNGDWLRELNYINLLRDVGVHFSVNKMLTAECFKAKMEKGLTFLEFNYMIMQAYDFYHLNKEYNCKLQMGGNDQWSNIIAGVNLTRKKSRESVYGLTFKLLTTSTGEKMGKTVKGALWIDEEKTSPYEFFQYFRNVKDDDVDNCFRMLTFIELDEIKKLTSSKEAEDINKSKEILAYEVTKIIHGKEHADRCLKTAREIFTKGYSEENMPTLKIEKRAIDEGIGILNFLSKLGVTKSNGEARTLISQGGVSINEKVIDDIKYIVNNDIFDNESIILKKGKKNFYKIIIV